MIEEELPSVLMSQRGFVHDSYTCLSVKSGRNRPRKERTKVRRINWKNLARIEQMNQNLGKVWCKNRQMRMAEEKREREKKEKKKTGRFKFL